MVSRAGPQRDLQAPRHHVRDRACLRPLRSRVRKTPLPAHSTLPDGAAGAGPGPPAGGLLPRALRAPAGDTVCITTGPGGRR